MKFTLYIGNNKNDLIEYGFSNVMINNASHYTNGYSAYNSLLNSDILPQIIFCKIDSQINPIKLIKLIKANIQPYVRRMHAYGRYGSGESDRRIRNCARALKYIIFTLATNILNLCSRVHSCLIMCQGNWKP